MPGKTVDVLPGDTLISIAHREGFRSWEAIYDHPDNAELKKKRPDPNQLLPGDKVVIPEKQPKEFKVQTNQRHEFVARSLRAHLRLIAQDRQGKPCGSCKFVVTIDGKKEPLEGTTTPEGLVDVRVPAHASRAFLQVWPAGARRPLEWELAIGHLAPIEEEAGVKARLLNLGYSPGTTPEAFKAALQQFQRDEQLEPTGTVDDKTKTALVNKNGR